MTDTEKNRATPPETLSVVLSESAVAEDRREAEVMEALLRVDGVETVQQLRPQSGNPRLRRLVTVRLDPEADAGSVAAAIHDLDAVEAVESPAERRLVWP